MSSEFIKTKIFDCLNHSSSLLTAAEISQQINVKRAKVSGCLQVMVRKGDVLVSIHRRNRNRYCTNKTSSAPKPQLAERSTNEDRLRSKITQLFYLLMRDACPTGELVRIIRSIKGSSNQSVSYTSKELQAYAEHLVREFLT